MRLRESLFNKNVVIKMRPPFFRRRVASLIRCWVEFGACSVIDDMKNIKSNVLGVYGSL